MNGEEALEEISSPALRANLSVISGTSAFFKAIANYLQYLMRSGSC